MTQRPEGSKIDLAGAWRKKERPSLRRQVPDSLTFSTGTYRGARGGPAGFIWWDAGIYRMEGERRLLLSTASDELTPTRCNCTGTSLPWWIPDGCRFSYQRARRPAERCQSS